MLAILKIQWKIREKNWKIIHDFSMEFFYLLMKHNSKRHSKSILNLRILSNELSLFCMVKLTTWKCLKTMIFVLLHLWNRTPANKWRQTITKYRWMKSNEIHSRFSFYLIRVQPTARDCALEFLHFIVLI